MTNEEAIKILSNATFSAEWQGNEDLTTAYLMAIEALKNERPQGEWMFSGVEHTADNPIDSDCYYCSICKRSISTTLTRPTELFPFCHCGADMRGDPDEVPR